MIGREEERQMLLERAQRDEAQLIIIYGRRRVGKTYLVRETFEDNFIFSYTGYENVPKKRQLEEFAKALGRYSLQISTVPKDWFSAFDLLLTLIKSHGSKSKTVFIDEMPWMDNRNSEFMTALEGFWNGRAYAIDKKEDLSLRNKRSVFERKTRTRKAVHLILVTTYSFKHSGYSSVFQSQVCMDDLFR